MINQYTNNKKRIFSEEHRKNLSVAGKIAMNKPEIKEKLRKSKSKETKRKISVSRTGKCVGENHSFYGKHHTKKTKEKIRNKLKGRKRSEEIKNKIRNTLNNPDIIRKMSSKGRKHTDKTKQKISIANKGHITTDETKEKIRKALKGKNRKKLSLDELKNNLKNFIKYKGETHATNFLKESDISSYLIRRILNENNVTLEDLANLTDVKFLQRGFNNKKGRIGKNEKQILDEQEQIIGRKIKRQYYVNKFYVDGYDDIENIVYEIDDKNHFNKNGELKTEDIIRENKIKEKLNCNFVRIKDVSLKNNNLQKGLNDFK